MNDTVTATGMKVKAVAEGGIVISSGNTDSSTWSASANGVVASAELRPTSAPNVATPTWTHAKSSNADDANQQLTLGGTYTDLSIAWSDATNSAGIGYVEKGSNTTYDSATDEAYILANNFYIKSSGEDLTSTNLYINDVTVTSSATGGSFNKIDNALRVLVVLTQDTTSYPFLFAPVKDQASGTTSLTYKYKKNTDVSPRYVGGTGTTSAYDVSTGITSIPSTSSSAINVKVYMFYEGEDQNLKSTNISGITMNDLNLTVNFGTTQLHAPTGD